MELRSYQQVARDFIFDRYERAPGSGLWLGCGLGKTAVTLHAIQLLREWKGVGRTIVVAPARVIATSWPKEIREWGMDLTWDWLNTSNWQDVMKRNADILFVGCEDLSMRQLSEDTKAKRGPGYMQLAERIASSKLSADLIVVDEVTKFKSWSAARSKVIRQWIRRIPNRITLTGSPTPNHLGEVFPQHYILDEGQTLTPYIGNFRNAYMRPCGYENRDWEMRPEMVEPLLEKLRPWYLCQEAVDHLELPEMIENIIEVDLPPRAKAQYKSMEKKMFAELEEGDEVVAMTGGAKYALCRQMASGCVYSDSGSEVLHTAKVEALRDLYEAMNGKPLLVAYWFIHESELLQRSFPEAAIINGQTSTTELVEIIARWQRGEIPMILAQASTISHGVDGLQKGCNDLCWYTLSDNPDIVHQLKHRIYRQGNDGNKVRIHYLMASGTIDRTVLRAIREKAANQQEVINRVKMSTVDRSLEHPYTR